MVATLTFSSLLALTARPLEVAPRPLMGRDLDTLMRRAETRQTDHDKEESHEAR